MALSRTFQKSFSGGEIAPTMLGRIDDPKYQNGATRLENMVALPQGPAVRRPGFELVAASSATLGREVRLVPFDYSNSQAFAVELGSKVQESGTTAIVDSAGFSVTGTPWGGGEWEGYQVECGGSTATVVSNTSSNVEIDQWLPTTPESGSDFVIFQGFARFHTQGQTLLTPAADAYVANIATTTWASSTFDFGVAHNFADNAPVKLTGASLPAPLVEERVYYVDLQSTNTFRVRSTPGGSFVSFIGGSGTVRAHYAYTPGDLTSYGGATWYCRANTVASGLSIVPGTDPLVWFQMPADGVYEVPTPWGDYTIPVLTYAQKNDVLRIATALSPVFDLKRLGPATWILDQVVSEASLAAPTNLGVTATEGAGQEFSANGGTVASGQVVEFLTSPTTSDCLFAPGDYVRADLVLPISGSVLSVGAGESDFIVHKNPAGNEMLLARPGTGELVTFGSGAANFSRLFRLVDPSLELTNYYVVTAVDAQNVESEVSNEVSSTTNLFAQGAYNTLTWDAVEAAVRYRVYKKKLGLFGFIGETDGTELDDRNLGPDLSRTPPLRDSALTGTDQPNCAGWFQGRCVFGGGAENPQRILMTRSGTESDLSYSLPTIDSDRINQTISAGRRCEIRHIVPLQQLLLLGDTAVIRVTGANSDVITPSSIDQRIQSHVGASPISPVVASTTVLFCDARGGHLREAGFSSEAGGYVTGDASIRASHLFDGYDLVSLALTRAPYQIVWAVSTSGQLLGLTYVPEERVGAWHRHTTDGTFKSCCAIPDGDEDRLYVVVERTINGVTGNYIERMAEFAPAGDLEDRVYVDCAVVATTSSSTGVVTGLDHLTGESVAVLADGVVQARKVVDADGEITIAAKSASVVHVGLPYTSTVIPAPVSAEVEAYGQGRPKNVSMASLKVYDTLPFLAGPSDSQLRTAIRGTAAFTGEVDILQLGSWNTDGSVWLVQRDPVPMNLVAVTLKVAFGG